MFFRMIYDENLAAASYLIGCQKTGEAILIDPERDIDRYLLTAKKEGLRITAVTETHIHADFLSGTREIAEATGAKVYLSDEGAPDWQYEWLDKKSTGESYTHVLLKDGSTFFVGNIEFKVLHTPGHTPEHICFIVTDKGGGATEAMGIATGDFLFVGDLGRPDLLETAAGKAGTAGISASALFNSVQLIKNLPDFMQVWPAHGAGSACGKALGAVPTSTIGYEKRFNQALLSATSEPAFSEYILSGQPEPPLYFARMKAENKAGPALLGKLPTPKELSLDEIRNLDPKKAALIDTRSWAEFKKGHITGSLFHPVNKAFSTDIGSFVEKDSEIYLICNKEDIENAVRNLVRVGLDNVKGWVAPYILEKYSALSEIKEEDVEAIKQKIAEGSVNVLDVRRAAEFSESHIKGAKNIVHTRLASKLSEVPKGKPLVVNCQGGTRSAYASALLQRAGFDVINLKGGIQAWQKSHA